MSDPFLGEIKMVAFNFAPVGYASCDGAALSIAQNNALFALLGTTYGGNGQNNFQLPDYQGRTAIGAGAGAGLTPVTQGEKAGSENVTLTTSQLPPHAHTVGLTVSATPTNPLTSPTSTNNVLGASPSNGQTSAAIWSSQVKDPISLAPSNSGTTGSATPVGIRPPQLGTNFIIALQGIFPSRQ